MPGLSPFTQEILRFAWEKLFDAAGPYFLPDLLRPHLEPLSYDGPSPAVTVPADDEVCDSACMVTEETPINPIASSRPSLRVMNARIRGLYAVSATPLTFSTTQPELTAKMNLGKYRGGDVPVIVDGAGKANYGFAIDCCIPVSDESRTCGTKKWTATAQGKFTATVRASWLTARIRADFPDSGDAKITVVDLKLQAEQSDIDIEFDVQGLSEGFVALAEQAVQTGIGTGAVQTTLQEVMDRPAVKAEISRILTKAINDLAVQERA